MAVQNGTLGWRETCNHKLIILSNLIWYVFSLKLFGYIICYVVMYYVDRLIILNSTNRTFNTLLGMLKELNKVMHFTSCWIWIPLWVAFPSVSQSIHNRVLAFNWFRTNMVCSKLQFNLLTFSVKIVLILLLSVYVQVAVVVTEPDSEQVEEISTPPTEPQVEPLEAGKTEPWSKTQFIKVLCHVSQNVKTLTSYLLGVQKNYLVK